jgi:STE24 endopeptidase
MAARTALLVTSAVLLAGLVVVLAVTTPWRPLPVDGPAVAADVSRDFTADEVAREEAYHSAVRPPAYASLLLGLGVALLLGLSPLGARLVGAAAAPLGGGWGWRVLLGGVALTAVGRLAALPLDAWTESVRQRYGLSTRTWLGWLTDVGKSYAVGLVLTLIVLFGIVLLLRWAGQWWWTWGAAGGALLVVVVSFAYPVVVEPVFNRFTPLPTGELRTSLLEMAESDGVPARDVLVADASRRTSAVNAYVSGFGATRRIVVYDTLLERASPEEVRLVVAHELGHARNRDVLWGTLMGALGVAVAVCALAWALRWGALLRRAGVDGPGDPRVVALLLAVVAVLVAVSGPVQALVSRRIEARADVHALDLTRDPAAFAQMQRRLAVSNLSDVDPSPVVFGLFSTHPTAPQRISLARDWARQQGLPEPPSMAR